MISVLLSHNSYQQPGGEDSVFCAERDLLASAGHRLIEYYRHNDEILKYGLWSKLTLGLRAVWAWDAYNDIRDLVKRNKPDVAHFHNTFPLISPAAYYACREAGVPVVQTLHNYRLVCPAATFYRNERVCEECCDHGLWRGVRHGCYRGSHAATGAVALLLEVHRMRNTWIQMVDRYVALTEFARQKLVEAGLPAEKIVVKPNFVFPDPGKREEIGEYSLFVGRLSVEKGVSSLLDAWARLRSRVPLWIVGDGPLRMELESQAARQGLSGVVFRGRLTRTQTLAAIKGARFLVLPSRWYELFPMTIAEAFACGTPVIVSHLGAMPEIVENGRTGLSFMPGNAEHLTEKVDWAWTHPQELEAMGNEARNVYEARYSADRNYQSLMSIYQQAIGDQGRRTSASAQRLLMNSI